eukprot:TRINITY_DN8170_c0_g2_i1.p1 TRINITY_DN8170_c0_g2~~TRINITY_DN8170_c0_g2_i1.p1  ORF type:complete len:590 (+),score=164.95 TRINITY_DN8170_c0_g2_i1:95-1864(+)
MGPAEQHTGAPAAAQPAGLNPLRGAAEGLPLLSAEQHKGGQPVGPASKSAPACESAVYPWWTPGDTDAFAALTCDNIAAQLTLIFGLLNIMKPSVIFGRIWPGLAISVLFGNWYYSWQATRLARREGRGDVTAQPYGINTPGAFPFMYTIIYGVYNDATDPANPNRRSADEAADLAWKVGAFACFVSGMIEILMAPFGRRLRSVLPTPVLMAPLCGIGLTDLAFRGFADVTKEPVAALLPLSMIICGFFAEVRFGKIPVAVAAIASGTAIAWAGGFKSASEVTQGADWLRDRWDISGVNSTAEVLAFPLGAVFTDSGLWDDVLDYMGTIVPVAIINFFCTVEALESAEDCGDRYGTTETLFIDGVGSCLGALFGSVFGTTVYIGQPAYKRMGGRRGYTVATGTVVGILGITGLIAPVYQCLDLGSVKCAIIFVGLTIASQTIRLTPPHQYPAVLLGILPIVATYAASFVGDADADANRGLLRLGDGALLSSICITAISYYTIDRSFGRAALAAAISSALSLLGFVHSGAVSARIDRHKHQWHFALGYGAVAAWCCLLRVLQARGWVDAPRRAAGEERPPHADPAPIDVP